MSTPTEPPRLHLNKQTVSLSFESTLIQSSMRRADPNELVLDYTRTMMGALLFDSQPGHVLMIGLGGGSMVKYLYHYVPQARITAVEINQGVIDMRQEFCIPPDDERLRVLCEDGALHVAQHRRTYDLILVDGFTGEGLPPALSSDAFYRACKAALKPGGIMVANVQADTQETRTVVKRIQKAFDRAVISVESDEGGNEIVTAGEFDTFMAARADFTRRWERLDKVHRETLSVCSSRFERALLRLQEPAN
ncbi:fused MFS/spermidine synthase [Aquabacterium sp.]|uniref:fused MFS/spermidine synthase n=1 Tax=Aquabacterium sp. TaxID=1872578 RepID=UPI002E301B5E|nr:fused MFS/spermidine synthase [Aquabacterium sp.]HEX5311698.1 fused MFS/spermidine synthase [Aquabacterium sp.]